MLHLLLSPTDGGTTWRHLLAPGEARTGFEPVGPLGLVRRLGRILGIPGESAGAPERLASFTQRLDEHDDGSRSYSSSRKKDPFGVARYLLSLRDDLRLSSWDGRALDGSARLRDLSALEQVALPVPPGLPDVVAELIAGLKGAGALPFPVSIALTSPRRAFPPLFRSLLDAVATAGATVTDAAAPTPIASPSSDLGRLQRAILDPTTPRTTLDGDGTFLLLEADTPLEAAELTASFTRTRALGDATFVVAAEGVTLDTALARQGLPTLGLASSSHLRPHLQVLPLRLALAFKPQDPFRAAELLLLPGGPLPPHAKRKLLGALDEMPGIRSRMWLAAIEEAVVDETGRNVERGASQAAAESAGASLRARIETWFGGELFDPVEGISAAKAALLCSAVATWAGGRVKGAIEEAEAGTDPDAGDDTSLWAHAAAVARTLEQLLIARPAGERMTQQALMQLHDLAVGNGSDLAAFTGESGRPAIASSPGAVTTPCAEVVWWGFVVGADPGPPPEPWTDVERDALLGSGITLPVPGERREIEAEGWRRPVLAARERLTLARWRLSATDPIAPHALFDELSTRVTEGSLPACTVASDRVLSTPGAVAHWNAATTSVTPRTLMAQRATWTVPPDSVAFTARLSASALEVYLGCPFRWALENKAQLHRGGGVTIPEGNRLLGTFAHRILQDMLCGAEKLAIPQATAAQARAWATKAFDERVGVEAAPLVRRGREVELDRARTLVANAAAALVDFLRTSGWQPVDAEREVEGTFAGQPAHGFVDLVVEKDGGEALVDLKLSGLKYRQKDLEEGRALQPALYASMMRKGGQGLPPSGFFVLEDGQLVTTEPQAFPGATVVEGPGPKATLEGSAEGFGFWRKVLATGVLPVLHDELSWAGPVTAAAGAPPEEDSLARREPPCGYCDYKFICVPPAVEDEEVAP